LGASELSQELRTKGQPRGALVDRTRAVGGEGCDPGRQDRTVFG
jgi:hypothetical protein